MIPLVGAGGNVELRLAQPCGPSGVPASVDARVEPPRLVVPCRIQPPNAREERYVESLRRGCELYSRGATRWTDNAHGSLPVDSSYIIGGAVVVFFRKPDGDLLRRDYVPPHPLTS